MFACYSLSNKFCHICSCYCLQWPENNHGHLSIRFLPSHGLEISPCCPIPKQPLIPSVFKIQAKISAWCFLAYIHSLTSPNQHLLTNTIARLLLNCHGNLENTCEPTTSFVQQCWKSHFCSLFLPFAHVFSSLHCCSCWSVYWWLLLWNPHELWSMTKKTKHSYFKICCMENVTPTSDWDSNLQLRD